MCNGLGLPHFHFDLNALLFSCNRRSLLWVREHFRISNGLDSRNVLNVILIDGLDGLTSRTVEIVNLSKRLMECNVEQVETSKGLILLKSEILNVPRFHMARRAQLVEIS
ncbi:hypothetical protein M514_02330 [Trichuris suis]|uniref:Uncharacterized protein n=1 Tax=Trichuris suis TaxID=68888 RepID=A0A085NBI5_9BILA|nr:hypothetical protein M513_02330 [Trichuris suis]KFD66831.1 hypothetical protein M514_02330 [Trichuris suis]